jgi:hypothetical protein
MNPDCPRRIRAKGIHFFDVGWLFRGHNQAGAARAKPRKVRAHDDGARPTAKRASDHYSVGTFREEVIEHTPY